MSQAPIKSFRILKHLSIGGSSFSAATPSCSARMRRGSRESKQGSVIVIAFFP
jgi:hypothetical protein